MFAGLRHAPTLAVIQMRHLILSILIVLITQISLLGQNNLESWASKKDTAALRSFVLKSDKHFAKDWSFEKSTIKGDGCDLTWLKTINDTQYLRTYCFNRKSKDFISCYEERFFRDSLISVGPVEFKNRTIEFIEHRIVNKKSLIKTGTYWNFLDDGYFYEIYHNGKISCIYQTKSLNLYYMLFERANKDKIELIKGSDCLGILR